MIDYPKVTEERLILSQNITIHRFEDYKLKSILSPSIIISLQKRTKQVFTSKAIKDYIVQIVAETRKKEADYSKYGANTDSGNLKDVDPRFVKVTETYNNVYELDLRLRDASPARTASGDGTEIGVYGGLYPFRALQTGGGSAPLVQELVTSGVVKKGTPLKVTVKARGN